MPAATDNTSMPARDFLNSYAEDLFIKDIQDNFDGLLEQKKDTNAHLLVEKYWIQFKKILDDADDIGYRENERLKDFAIDISLKMIDIFVETIQTNKVPEADLEEYCEHQVDVMIDIVKRYNIDDDYMHQVAGIICKYCQNYVDQLDNLPFEEFYKYTKKKNLVAVDVYYDKSMRQLGIELYLALITAFIDKFRNDSDPQIRRYVEEYGYLLDKTAFFEFTHAEGVPEKLVAAALILIEGGMEKKYADKEVMREVIKQTIAFLNKHEIMSEVFWNTLTEIVSRYMKMMAENDERVNFKFYWVFAQEIEILDRVGMSLEDAQNTTGTVPAKRPAAKTTAKKAAKKRNAGGLQEL